MGKKTYVLLAWILSVFWFVFYGLASIRSIVNLEILLLILPIVTFIFCTIIKRQLKINLTIPQYIAAIQLIFVVVGYLISTTMFG